MQVYKETIWHFTCQSCNGFWSIAASDKWIPKELYCTHCGSKRTHSPEKIEWVDDNDYIPTENDTPQQKYFQFEEEFLKDEFNINGELKKSTITPDPDIIYSNEWCSCRHKKIDCDCKPGCKCECNKKFLGAY
jgi:hypothetical protein